MSKIEFENSGGYVCFEVTDPGTLNLTVCETGKDRVGPITSVDLKWDNVQELTSYLIGTSAANSYSAQSNEPTHKQSAYDTVLHAIDQWHREGVNTFEHVHVQAALAALLIAHKAKRDPADVMEAHLAEEARKRAETQWLDTYNASIAQPGSDTNDSAVIDRATRLADATHGRRFRPQTS